VTGASVRYYVSERVVVCVAQSKRLGELALGRPPDKSANASDIGRARLVQYGRTTKDYGLEGSPLAPDTHRLPRRTGCDRRGSGVPTEERTLVVSERPLPLWSFAWTVLLRTLVLGLDAKRCDESSEPVARTGPLLWCCLRRYALKGA
jgi:hypothetical protein